jgi:hypothetical protein
MAAASWGRQYARFFLHTDRSIVSEDTTPRHAHARHDAYPLAELEQVERHQHLSPAGLPIGNVERLAQSLHQRRTETRPRSV